MISARAGVGLSPKLRHQALWSLRSASFVIRPSYFTERWRAKLETRLDRAELRRIRSDRPDPSLQPLVSVRIATFSAGDVIARTLESCLKQTYPNIEVVVVGDCCDEATEKAVARFTSDGRVRFVNLGLRGQYPPPGPARWQVAGTTPMNVGSLLARGEWIAPCDDDDEFTPDHVERLLDHALATKSEMVWSDAEMQQSDGSWRLTPGPPLKHGRISHGSVMYRSDLRFMALNRRSYLIDQPADWNLWSRMERSGVAMTYLPAVTYRHYFNSGNGAPAL